MEEILKRLDAMEKTLARIDRILDIYEMIARSERDTEEEEEEE